MAKKTVKNRYGVQVDDIFVYQWMHEDDHSFGFYQVVALRGETQVAVRRICKKIVAFDGTYEEVQPILGDWLSGEILVRKVHGGKYTSIQIHNFWYGFAHLMGNEICREWDCIPNKLYNLLQVSYPELAKELCLETGSGVYAADTELLEPWDWKTRGGSDCRAIIRYPDGNEQEVLLQEWLHYEEALQKRKTGELFW